MVIVPAEATLILPEVDVISDLMSTVPVTVCSSTLPEALMGPLTVKLPVSKRNTKAPSAEASLVKAVALTSTALLPVPWLPVISSASASWMNTPPVPVLLRANLSICVVTAYVPEPMPAPARNTAEDAAPSKLGVALLLRPLVRVPAVASTSKLPSACKILRLTLREATRLIDPVCAALVETSRWPSSITMSRLASTEIKPSVCKVFCSNTSWPVELKWIKPVVLVIVAVLTTLPLACAVKVPPFATTPAAMLNWLPVPAADSKTVPKAEVLTPVPVASNAKSPDSVETLNPPEPSCCTDATFMLPPAANSLSKMSPVLALTAVTWVVIKKGRSMPASAWMVS